MKQYNGETREEYLVWVKNWKAEYKQLSVNLRYQKDCRPLYLWGRNPKNKKGDNASYKKWVKLGFNPIHNSSADFEVLSLKLAARLMLKNREDAKWLAQQQWEAHRLRSDNILKKAADFIRNCVASA